jgi:hypothetical protein
MKLLFTMFLLLVVFFTHSIPVLGQTLYRSNATGNWNTTSTWQVSTNGGSTWGAASSTPTNTNNSGITIQNTNTVTVTAAVSIDEAVVNTGGQININSGITLTIADGSGIDLTDNGTIVNSGTITPTGTISFASGGTYQHSQDGGTIPTATWNANSTCLITNIIGTFPSGLGQTFGHLTWNCPSQTKKSNLGTLSTVNGNFTLTSAGTGELRFESATTTINGNYSQTSGSIRLATVGGNDRTLTVGGSFFISGGTILMTTGNGLGTINVAGDFTYSSGSITETGSGDGAIIFNGSGIQNYTGGGTFGNTINFTVNSGATLYLGNYLFGSGSDGTFTLSSGGTLGIGHSNGIVSGTGATTSNVASTGTRTFSAGANYVYNGTVAQLAGSGLPTSAITGNVTIANTLGVTPTNDIIVSGTLTVNGLLTPTAAQVISGSGTLTGSGTAQVTRTAATADFNSQYTITTKTLTNLTVDYAGTAAQIISALTYGGLSVNNLSGLTLGGNVSIDGVFTLTSGRVTLSANNITLGSSATIGGTPSATTMVVATGSGELRKTFTATGSFTFPVGDNTGTAEYSPATLNFTSGSFSSAYAGVSLTNNKHTNNGSTTDFIIRYWTVTSSGITSFSCNVTFKYVDPADINGTEANLYCGKWSGSAWTLLNAVDTGSDELSGTVTSFSDFTGGEQSPLPVELVSFSAAISDTEIILNWLTATEVNNYGFEIQRSVQTNKWDVLGFVEGHGNSNSLKDYSFTDSEINTAGIYYYRLKQIDNDGAYEFSNQIEVNFGSPNNFELSQNYPNPFNPSTTISFKLPKSGAVTLKVYNLMGEEIKTLAEGYREAGIHSFSFNAEGYPSGMYLYRLSTNGYTKTKKMLLMK